MKEIRKLATIAKIKNIEPIDGADSIEVATIRGWKVVIKKNDFIIGDLCVYCEIDSVLPDNNVFEFLRNKNFRIKTIKLRKQISNGIAFPLSILESITGGKIIDKTLILYQKQINKISLVEDFNVTSLMKVRKYEPNIPNQLRGIMKGNYPSHSIKTDEERIENLSGKKYENLKLYTYYETEKLDGSSMTCYLKDDIFGVTSRNIDLLETKENSFWKVARELKIEENMRVYASAHNIINFNIQGELIGEGIQENKYKLKGQTLKLFRSFDIDKFEFYDYKIFIKMIKEMNLKTVPILGIITLPNTIDELKIHVHGKSLLNSKIEREGSVFVSTYIDKKHQGRLSFKSISDKYLLKDKS